MLDFCFCLFAKGIVRQENVNTDGIQDNNKGLIVNCGKRHTSQKFTILAMFQVCGSVA